MARNIDTMKCPRCGTHLALYRLELMRQKPPLFVQFAMLILVVGTACVALVMLMIFAPDFSNDVLLYWITLYQRYPIL